jgi:hypothetical protein
VRALDELAGLLGRERRLLEVLLFKLVEARHLLAAGEVRFLPWAAGEVERAVERVREADLLRATALTKISADLNIPMEKLSLKELADDSVEPYRTVFSDHRNAFLELVAEIEDVVAANRKLAGQGMNGISEVLSMIESAEQGKSAVKFYGPKGAGAGPRRRAEPLVSRFDGAL